MFSGWFRRLFNNTSSQPIRHESFRHGKRLLVEQLEDRDVPSQLLGNQIFPSDNPWNQIINQAPVSVNSATWVNSIGLTSTVHPDFGSGQWAGANMGIPYNVVSGTQPKLRVIVDAYPDESDLVSVPIPANARIEGDPLTSGDRHLLVYDKDNNILYELYRARRPSETGDGLWHADSLAVWDLNRNHYRPAGYTSADAAGLPILPGLIRAEEVLTQGRIEHAIRFTAPRTQNAYVFPASHHAGQSNTSLPPMGARFRLQSSFDISGFSPTNRIILQALKDYGMILADNGSSWYLSGESSPLWDNDDLHSLARVVGSNFEAVDLKPMVSQLSASAGPAGSSVTIVGVNFSGGAGQTQVFFGSTQATSFTINSDSSITAITPPGTNGTAVNVTVQSPYGTSVVSSGSRFTFSQTSDQDPEPPPPNLNPGEFNFASGSFVVAENAGTVTLPVRRLFGSDGQASVSYIVTAVTAGSQTILSQTGTITFESGQTSQDVVLSVQDDTLANGDQNFTVTLADPTGEATLGQLSNAALKVVDNEVALPGKLQFGAPKYIVSEGVSLAAIEVTRTGGSKGRVTVQYFTWNGTARAGYDYQRTRGTLVFEDGEISKTIFVPVIDDLKREANETLRLYLTRPTGKATLGPVRSALIVLIDNDAPAGALPAPNQTNMQDLILLATYENYWPWANRKTT
jgi:hypothetical protein